VTTDMEDITSTRRLTETGKSEISGGDWRVHREIDTSPRERVITLSSEPTIDYLSTKYLLSDTCLHLVACRYLLRKINIYCI